MFSISSVGRLGRHVSKKLLVAQFLLLSEPSHLVGHLFVLLGASFVQLGVVLLKLELFFVLVYVLATQFFQFLLHDIYFVVVDGFKIALGVKIISSKLFERLEDLIFDCTMQILFSWLHWRCPSSKTFCIVPICKWLFLRGHKEPFRVVDISGRSSSLHQCGLA